MEGTPNVVGAEPAAPNDRSPLTEADPAGEPSDRVVLGVAGHLADLLGVDALWVRVAFVVLALTGGLGIVIYLASWLILFGPDRTGMDWMRYLGGAIAVIGVPIMIADGSLEFYDGPVAVVALLIGLTLALWQPRNVATPRPAGRPLPGPLHHPLHRPLPREGAESIVTPTVDVDDREPVGDVSPAESEPRIDWNRRPARRARPRREPSTLGRATLGLAVIVAAAGSLIDQFNGGRLHPEQWLGAAAVVCGIGLLVGVLRGRAWWLIVPALLFAGTGYFAGLMARLGIDAVDAVGDQSLYVSDTTPAGEATLQTGIGTIWITVDGAPADPLTIDARLALGTVEVRAVDDVAIEIHSETDRGDLIVDGVVASGGVTRIGPDRAPDVIVDARQGIGDVVVQTYFPGAKDRVVPPRRPVPDVPDVAPVPTVIPSAPSITSPSVIDPTVPPSPSATTVPPTPSTTIGD